MGVKTPTPTPTPEAAPALPGSPAAEAGGASPAAVEERETWGKKVDFLLSVIGFAVDLANVWRFPYLCYKNGGGAFLIPYLVMLCIGGIPLFYMELVIGQYNRKGAITCWGRLVPLFKVIQRSSIIRKSAAAALVGAMAVRGLPVFGIGYAVALIAFYVDFYYNVIIAWALHFFFSSFTVDLPWMHCSNPWNTPNCTQVGGSVGLIASNATSNNSHSFSTTWSPLQDGSGDDVNRTYDVTDYDNMTSSVAVVHKSRTGETSPAAEYFNRAVLELHKSGGIDNLGSIKWDLALCLLAVYLICYFSLWKGISTSGKVVWFTALFPYVVLFILLIRGITLPGAGEGIRYYLTPNFASLKDANVWVDAATQVFFSLGPGFGVLLAFASYNKFHNNVYKDAILTSLINSATSFLSGFVIFSVLGYMAHKAHKEVKDVATEGPGLVFIVYPEAIATMPGATFWALIFFMMLLTLGLDSSFGGSEAIITAVSDEYPIIGRHREIFVALLFSLYYVIGMASCAQGGAYVVQLLDRYAAGYSILFAVFFEAIAVSWIYGIDRFSNDIKEMMGFYPGAYWKICWKFIAPAFILIIIIYGLASYEPLTYEDYVYPEWANILGWMIAASSVMCIPIVACWKMIVTPGSFMERLKFLTTPWRDHQVCHNIKVEANQVKLMAENGPAEEDAETV